MNLIELPDDLKSVIGSERIDFYVMAKRKHPKNKAVSFLMFSLLWNGIMSFGVVAFVISNSRGSVWPTLLQALAIFGIFIVIGLLTFYYAVRMLIQKGGYFIGTERRLIHHRKGKTIITDWRQFSGNIEMTHKDDFGNLTLQLKTGKMSGEESSDRFIPDIIYMVGIPGVLDIEKKCRARIYESSR